MEARRLTTPQKIILWLLLILMIWQVLHIPAVIDAILTFILAGTVPGTQVVLSPETVIRGSGLVLLSIGSFLASRLIIAARARRVHAPKAPSPRHVYTSNKQGEVIKIPAAPAYHPPRTTASLPQAIRAIIDRIHYRFIVDLYIIKSDARKVVFWIADLLQVIWKWTEPYLWRFDAWLGVQYHLFRKELQRKMRMD